MITPPMLLGATLLFWGWQCDLLWLAVLLALALESSRVVTTRWELAQADLDRIWNLCAVLFFGSAIIAFASSDGPSAVTGMFSQNNPATRIAALAKSGRSLLLVLHWLPITLFPIAIAQVFGAQPRMDWSTFSWWLRRMRVRQTEKDPDWQGGLNVTWPYFAACLTAASASNNGQPFFFAGASALLAWALWPRRPRAFPVAAWGGCLIVVVALGYAGQIGLVQLRKTLEQLDNALVSRFAGSKFNPNENRTMLGSVGRLKLSGKIVMRVTAESNAPPALLREASFNLFKSPVWGASRKDFGGVISEKDGTTWVLSPNEQIGRTKALTIATLLPGGNGALALPAGIARLERLPVALETNRFGTAHAKSGPGYLEFRAQYHDNAFIESVPDADDLNIPTEERPALAQVAAELNLVPRPGEQTLAIVRSFFSDHFRYTTWLAGQHQARTDRTALAAFLLEHRSGHCEYFATASVLLLRQAGIPARYAVGYSVQERKGATYIVRERHGHAWCLAWINNGWREVDNTPASWHEIEGEHASIWEPFGDAWSRAMFAFSKWRWSEDGFRKYLLWLIVPLVLLLAGQLYFKRQWNRSRQRSALAGAAALWPGLDSDFYRIEHALVEAGFERRKGEPLSAWLGRAESAQLIRPADLDEALDLHYRLRFDPVGLGPDERAALRAAVEHADLKLRPANRTP